MFNRGFIGEHPSVDCGLVVNPGGLEAQIEAGIRFRLSAALHGQVTFRQVRV
jgi:isoquinoline 1-oxidoreductase beta subunit